MALYRFVLRPCSAFATPLHSDTLAGHLVWAVAEKQGDVAATNMVEAFRHNAPPFVLSCAFPQNYLPMPVFPARPREEIRAFANNMQLTEKDFLQEWKQFKKEKFLPYKTYAENDTLNQMELFKDWHTNKQSCKKDDNNPFIHTYEQFHNSIDRITDTVSHNGGLYSVPTLYYSGPMHLYAATDDVDMLTELLAYIGHTGFGRDRSTGKGQFTVELDKFTAPAKPDAQYKLLLSRTASENMADFTGSYALATKRGKACGAMPFKSPFVQFTEGSIFSSMPQSGYVLDSVHPDDKVSQLVWPLTLPLQLA